MTKEQAKQALIEGKKIRHKSSRNITEYLVLRDTSIVDDMGFSWGNIRNDSWTGQKDGWEIYDYTALIVINKDILKQMFRDVMDIGRNLEQSEYITSNEILEEYLKDKL